MLGRAGPGLYRFRLVGGFVADLHGRDLRQDDLLSLWKADDRTALQLALEAVRRRPEPLVVAAEARAKTGATLAMEVMLAPLLASSGQLDRFIGLYQPTSPVAALMGQAVEALTVKAVAIAGPSGEAPLPRLRLAALEGRRIA